MSLFSTCEPKNHHLCLVTFAHWSTNKSSIVPSPIADFGYNPLVLRKTSFFLFAILLCAPLLAKAEQQTTLTLSEPQEQELWRAIKLTGLSITSDGLRIQAPTAGNLLRSLTLTQDIDAIEITYVSSVQTDLTFLWQRQGDPQNNFLQLPLSFAPSNGKPTTLTVELSAVGNWTRQPVSIGFGIPAGTDITLQSIRLRGWSGGEKLLETWKCFWSFDILQPYSINFLWGPLLCSTTVARENLYHHNPPITHSALRLFYLVLFAAAVILFVRRFLRRPRRPLTHTLRQFLIVFLCAWVILDLRMGLEFFSQVRYDYVTYLSKPVGKRTFRVLRFFPDFTNVLVPLLKKEKRYVLLTPVAYTFTGYIRYFTYPSVPVTPAEGSGTTLWLVYDRPDIAQNKEGRLVENGQPISPPGSILHEFAKGIFLFTVTP